MYERTRDFIIYANTFVLLCTLALLIALVSTGTPSNNNMYWSKIRLAHRIQWWCNYTTCDIYYPEKYGYRASCSEAVFSYFQPQNTKQDLRIISTVGLSMVISTLFFALISFIPSCVSVFKKHAFGNLVYLLVVVIIGFVVGLVGDILLTYAHLEGMHRSDGQGNLGPCFAIAWLCTCLFLISVVLSAIILRTRRDKSYEVFSEEVIKEYPSSSLDI